MALVSEQQTAEAVRDRKGGNMANDMHVNTHTQEQDGRAITMEKNPFNPLGKLQPVWGDVFTQHVQVLRAAEYLTCVKLSAGDETWAQTDCHTSNVRFWETQIDLWRP